MKIAIYIHNAGIADVDCSDMETGNPGIGGTEYCILLLAQIYKQAYPADEVILIASREGRLPAVDRVIVEEDLYNVPKTAREAGADVLVVSSLYEGQYLDERFFDRVSQARQRTVTWGHNFCLSPYCNRLVACDYVNANVFVGRQQYDRYIDHAVVKKSTYIYNMYPMDSEGRRGSDFPPVVTYIGSLVPQKGFQVLAAAWKEILARVPDAQLNVIGSGQLYSRDEKLGRFGIAEERFEKEFMKGLTDENGDVLPSVHFLGVMGAEKKDVIMGTAVGVVNPTGRTETFGLSALDFESRGVPVVTIAKGGFLDTVLDGKTGLLYHSTSELAVCVAELLRDREKNIRFGEEGIRLAETFAPRKIIAQWHVLFERVCRDEKPDFITPDSFMNTNLKRFRVLNRRIKDKCGVEYPLSVIGLESFARNMLRKLGK